MKIDVMEDVYVIYLNKLNLVDLSFDDQDKLEDNFKKLFKNLKKYYNLETTGYYNIKIYLDYYYGAVLEIKREKIDYYDYFDLPDTVAMRIKKYDVEFLYKVDDYFFASKFLNKLKIYTNNDSIFIKINQKLRNDEYILLLEMSQIIYSDRKLNLKKLKLDNNIYN